MLSEPGKHPEQPASAVGPGAGRGASARTADLGSGRRRPCAAADDGARFDRLRRRGLRAARGYIPRSYAAVAAVLTVLPPQYVYFSDALYAETLFGLFTVLFFVLHRYRSEHGVLFPVRAVRSARLRGAHGRNRFARRLGRRQPVAEGVQARRGRARAFARAGARVDGLDPGGRVVARVPAAGVRLSNGAVPVLQRQLRQEPVAAGSVGAGARPADAPRLRQAGVVERARSCRRASARR